MCSHVLCKEVSRGRALPDPETFPYEWLVVRQYISMPSFMSVIGKHFESCREFLKECHKINKIIYLLKLSNYFTNIINIVRGIIKLSLLTGLKAFVFIMDSCDRSAIDYNNC